MLICVACGKDQYNSRMLRRVACGNDPCNYKMDTSKNEEVQIVLIENVKLLERQTMKSIFTIITVTHDMDVANRHNRIIHLERSM